MSKTSGKKAQSIHMIGNSHIDPVWLWPWTEGFSEVKSTFRAALDRLEEYPDFVFTCAGACYYEYVEQCCPEMFEEIRRWVKLGRWVPVNGWWLQPDCNIPCGESFARQTLYGQKYFLEKFGISCEVGYNVDSFGHGGMLPQILKKSGMDFYVFMRPGPHENAKLPDIFTWESIDGSRVNAFRIMQGYGTQNLETLRGRVKDLEAKSDALDLPVMLFYGVGNHGGGPTIAMLDQIETWRVTDKRLIYSSPNAYAEQLRGADLPIWKEDLQIHAIGCYSAMLTVKQQNRRAETGLLSAEKAEAMAHMLLGASQGGNTLKQGWKRVMYNQFHDLICGCSIRQAYEDATASYGYAQEVADSTINLALQKVTWAIDTLGDDRLPRSKDDDWKLWGLEGKGTPLVLYNPMPFDVCQPYAAAGELVRVTDEQGMDLAIQRVRSAVTNGEHDKWDTLFYVDVPAMGYATFWLHKGAYAPLTDGVLQTRANEMENTHLKLAFDEANGCIRQIENRETGRTYLKGFGAVGMVIDETHSDTWGHGLFEYRDVLGSFQVKNMDWIERGPLRATMRIESEYGESTLRQDISLARDASYIDIHLLINWREKHKLLKLEFPVDVTDAVHTAEIPFGIIERPMDGAEKPIQRWVDVSGQDIGFSVVNDSSHAVDVKNGTIRMTVLRSPIFADHFGKRDKLCEFTEQGEREVRFRLVPHRGDWRKAGVVRHAYSLNTPLMPIYESYHKGPLPQRAQGLSIDAPGVFATALKEAEDGGAYVLRCYEAHGQDTRATISLPMAGRTWQADFGHHEIKTFRIPYDAALPVEEIDLVER